MVQTYRPECEKSAVSQQNPSPDPSKASHAAPQSSNLPAQVPQQTPARRRLPAWNVILHDQGGPNIRDVVKTIVALTPLDSHEAAQRATQAKTNGKSLLLTTHRERAELYMIQFANHSVKVTIEAG